MPLIKSGSKAAVGKNIQAETAAGKPRAQAIAIALNTARRYAKRAFGGRAGYAEGGEILARQERRVAPSVASSAPSEQQQQAALVAAALQQQENERVGRLPMFAQPTLRQGYGPGGLVGEITRDVMPPESLHAPVGWDSPVVSTEAPSPKAVADFLNRLSENPDGETRQERAANQAKRIMSAGSVREALQERGGGAYEGSGVGSVVRGVSKATDPEGDVYSRVGGAGEAALGAMPGASMVRPAAAGLLPFMAASTAASADTLRDADWPALMKLAAQYLPGMPSATSTAEAAEPGQWEPPTPEQKKNPAWVKQEQDRLAKRGLYPADKVDGVYKEGTEGALKREWKLDQDAERARARQEQIESQRLELERTKAATAQAEADTKAANERRQQEAGTAASERKTKADAAREDIRKEDENSPGTRAMRSFAPFAASIPGAIISHYLGNTISGKVNASTKARIGKAEKLLEGDPGYAEKIGQLNTFYTQPGAQSLWPGQKPEPLFLRKPGDKPPFWKQNPDAPESGHLYPASKGYGTNILPPVLFGAAEMGAGTAGNIWQTGKKEAAEAAMRDPNASEADVRSAAALRDEHANNAALWEALSRFGQGTALYGGGKGALNAKMSTPIRPSNMSTADAWREDVMKEIAKKSAATKKSNAAEKAAKHIAKQKGATATEQAAKKPNGSGPGAPLSLLASGLSQTGSPSRELRSPDESLASPISAMEDHSSGGMVNEPLKHHSNYQPRDEGKFAGGPVYPQVSPPKPRDKGAYRDGGIVMTALRAAARYASGGKVGGALKSNAGGRTDVIPTSVPSGSYILPADFVNSIGEDSSAHGHRVWQAIQDKEMADYYGKNMPIAKKQMSAGGDAGGNGKVPIMAAGDEHVVPPEAVRAFGRGDMDAGHKRINKMVLDERQRHIRRLAALPPPQS